MPSHKFNDRCQCMIDGQLRSRDIRNGTVLEAMASVPRHCFVADNLIHSAYDDEPLPIGHGQTISQPYIVALMIQVAEINERSTVLEVGTGSGYAAAVLSHIARYIVTLERIDDLARIAQKRFNKLGYNNIMVVVRNGALGYPEKAPYDAIIVSAAAQRVPQPLLDQLATGGRLVIPIGDAISQMLTVFSRRFDGSIEEQKICGVRFVPLVDDQSE